MTSPSNNQTSRSGGRQYPRIEIDSPAAVRTADGAVLAARLRDVSPRGLQLHMSRAAAHRLRPSGKPIAPDSDKRVLVRLELPVIGGATRITAWCRLAHFSLNPDDTVAFGMQFKEFHDGCLTELWRFVSDSMVPAEVA